MKTSEVYYDNKVISKPWGYEYVIHRVKKNLSVTYLNINPGKSTSLHCHTKKKTGFIVLEGKARIQLGLWKSEQKDFRAPSKLMIRTGLFHSIKCISNQPLIALEFETPCEKNDLVRYNDLYGRALKPYEKGKKFEKKILNYIKLIKPKGKNKQKINFKNTSLFFENHSSFKTIISKSKNTIFAVVNGFVGTKNNSKVLAPGDIVKTGTIKKLSKQFKIKKKLTLLRVEKK